MRRMVAGVFVLVFIFAIWPTSEPVAARGTVASRGGPGSEGAVAVQVTGGDGGRGIYTINDAIPTAEGCAVSSLRWGLAGL
jgi:hypothetical protein